MDSTQKDSAIPSSGTWFASPGRASQQQVEEMAEVCMHNPIVSTVLESVEGFVIILNSDRQILAANPNVLSALNVSSQEYLLGLRPGEAFHCAYSATGPAGCGTSKQCATCGAVISILASQTLQQPADNECLMLISKDNKMVSNEFGVRATPLTIGEHQLTVFVIRDISAIKRRDLLENVFIHDLNNIITGLQGWSEILSRRPNDATAIAQKIVGLSSHLTQEVQSQRLLLQAERGELKPNLQPTPVSAILNGMQTFFGGYPPDKTQRLYINAAIEDILLNTSPPLLTRILANMVKNAMEATSATDHVHVTFENRDGSPVFCVHNPGVIPEEYALQIFKRSFSTKGENGRGLGTYSMKLFGEQYLGGKVGFTTSEEEGTTFSIKLPPETVLSADPGKA